MLIGIAITFEGITRGEGNLRTNKRPERWHHAIKLARARPQAAVSSNRGDHVVGSALDPRPSGEVLGVPVRGSHRTLTLGSINSPGFSRSSVLKSWFSGRSKSMRTGTRGMIFSWLASFRSIPLSIELAPPPKFVTWPFHVRS